MADADDAERLQKLAEAVIGARRGKGWGQHELAVRSCLSHVTIRQLESGRPAYRHHSFAHTSHMVEETLGWEPGSMSACIENGTPITIADAPPATAAGDGESQP